MEDSGIEDGGDQNNDNFLHAESNKSSRRSSIEAINNHQKTERKNSSPTKTFTQRFQEEARNTPPRLIPIQRIPIPGSKSTQPLVQWDTDDDSEEDIENFFPNARKESKMQELSDTFSIEEMSISGDEDEDDLHLIPPQSLSKKISCCNQYCTIF